MGGMLRSSAGGDGTERRPPLGHVTLVVLVVLTILALLPIDPQGPFDARTWEAATDVELTYPFSGAMIEPVAALGHVVAGAPDYKAALVSTLAWALCAGLVGGLVWGLTRRGNRRALRSGVAAVVGGAGTFLLAVLYFAFSALSDLPSWRLEATAPDVVLVDMQSHTLWSHDGMASVSRSLEWHRECGFDAVAITEHNNWLGAYAARAMSAGDPELPAVVPGVEIRRGRDRAYLILLGREETNWEPPEPLRQAIEESHRRGLAVTLLPWKLSDAGVRRIAEAGVDGFELANQGHPRMPEEVRSTLLEEAESKGLVHVASTDWHGWGGFCRAWSAVRIPGWRGLSKDELASAIVDRIRRRQAAAIQPVSAGWIGETSLARRAFAPLVESARYVLELTPARALGWWIWILAIASLRRRLAQSYPSPGAIMVGAAFGLLGAALLAEAIALGAEHVLGDSASNIAGDNAATAMALGVIGILASSVVLWFATRIRTEPRDETTSP